jgi:hypothetical protein
MANASLKTDVNSDFSFGVTASDNPPVYQDVDEETRPNTQRKSRRKSGAGDVLAAFVLLAAAIMGCLGVNSEMVIHYVPQAAAALHLTAPAAQAVVPAGANAQIRVWVDLKTGLYYCPGADSYGRTRSGRYLNQADARLGSFEPAERKECTTLSSALLAKEALAHR